MIRRQFIPYILAVAFFLVCVMGAYDRETGFTSLIHFGGPFADRAITTIQEMGVHVFEDNDGYDGQFYAQMSTDPLLRDAETAAAMDNPSYRGRRVLVPALSHLLALGSDVWSVHVYSLINVLFWLGLGVLAFIWIGDVSVTGYLRWIGCVFSLGVVTSVVLSLLELPALCFSLLGILLFARGRDRLSGVALAAGALSKETFILSGLALISRKELMRGGWILMASIIPLAAWLLYLWVIDLPPNLGHIGNFQFPLTGLWYELKTIIGYLREGKIRNLLALGALLYQMGYVLLRWETGSLLWRFSIPYMILAAFLGVAVWEADPGAAYRVLVPIPIVFNLLLQRDRYFFLHWLAGNLSLIISLKYLLRLS